MPHIHDHHDATPQGAGPGLRHVRLEGSEDVWDVLCETPTAMVLINRSAKRRDEIAALKARLDTLHAEVAATVAEVTALDVNGHLIDGP